MNDSERFHSQRQLDVSTKLLAFGSFCAVSIGFVTSVYAYTLSWSFYAVLSLFVLLISMRIIYSLGYRVSWDSSTVSMRSHGFAWIFGRAEETWIAYDDISKVRGEFGRSSPLQQAFTPFDHVKIYGRSHGPIDSIVIAPNFINLQDAKEVLRWVRERRPETVSREVSKFIDFD